MRRGTIGLLGPEPPTLLPTFRKACTARLNVLRLVDQSLKRYGFPAPIKMGDTTIELHNGDLLEGGRGEILLRAA
jgi:hypothetical protein